MPAKELTDLLFPGLSKTPEEIMARYPKRKLPPGAAVTRIAPSPTGFMHLGNLYSALVDDRLARTTGGVFMFRIEDTDQKRSVPRGVESIIEVFSRFGFSFDEGLTIDGYRGDYGPYRQREREEIYKVFAKALFEAGRAYPCFATEEELSELRARQEREGANPGYYGEYALWRGAPEDQIRQALDGKKPYVIRFRSQGDPEKKIIVDDLIRGRIEMPQNNTDLVLLKSDGIPTYHFAHVVDDTLMEITHVVRGEEYLSTLPWHIDMFIAMKELFGWRVPKYAHTAHMQKLDDGKKRKMSKRKDPELALEYYHAEGFPELALIEYLMRIVNSNFEEWRMANPDKSYRDFPFSVRKMNSSGALFDMDKLLDVSRNLISQMSAQEAFIALRDWAQKYDLLFYDLLDSDPAYVKAVLGIGRGGKKPRKDIAVWKDAKAYMSYFYDSLFVPEYVWPENLAKADVLAILRGYGQRYSSADDQQTWFDKLKDMASELGLAPEMKQYKENPEAYRGHVGDVSMVLRVAVTGRQSSPDLWESMKILKKPRIEKRLDLAAKALE